MDAVRVMRIKGAKRIPIVDNGGGLVGILSVDDLLDLLAEQMADLAKLISVEQNQKKRKPLPPKQAETYNQQWALENVLKDFYCTKLRRLFYFHYPKDHK